LSEASIFGCGLILKEVVRDEGDEGHFHFNHLPFPAALGHVSWHLLVRETLSPTKSTLNHPSPHHLIVPPSPGPPPALRSYKRGIATGISTGTSLHACGSAATTAANKSSNIVIVSYINAKITSREHYNFRFDNFNCSGET
jgi:hypothetical protein